MIFPQFHKFLEPFEDKFQHLTTGGIINFLSEEWIQPASKAKYEHHYIHLREPQVLTMMHLEAGFIIWLISVSFAMISFLLEWLAKLSEYFLVRFILKKCLELRIGEDNWVGIRKPKARRTLRLMNRNLFKIKPAIALIFCFRNH